jgi:hypothetical protein
MSAYIAKPTEIARSVRYVRSVMYEPSHNSFRLATLILAALLGTQSIWLLLTELSRPDVDQLPISAEGAAEASKQRNDAVWTAWIGAIRGDLWAESAFTSADLLWRNPDADQAKAALDRTFAELDRALGYAPHQAEAWLLLAGLEQRYRSPRSNPAEALRMSYYTGPSEPSVMPLRLLVAARLDALDDTEIQQFIRRDLHLLLAQGQTSAIAESYAGASPTGRRFIEQAVDEFGPAYRGLLRAGHQGP